jgi:hypothetical protein
MFWITAWAVTFTLPYLFQPEDGAGLGPMIGFVSKTKINQSILKVRSTHLAVSYRLLSCITLFLRPKEELSRRSSRSFTNITPKGLS